ncbi:MAG: hypothetical protein HZB42_10340 [Sphingobacteriales bacterium]|nr:hypothetical protein [Sphingobacteriales bacterium]
MKNILSLAVLALFFVSCKKNVDELPPATQTGANTFGAKVNGNFWVPQGFGSFPANDILEARMSGHDITINARNFSSSPNETEFQLTIYDVTAPGTYQFNTDVTHPNGAASYGYYVKRNFTPQNEWLTSATYTGRVIITRIDDVNRIVSGTFEFDAGSIYNADVLHVTEGRFDLKIQ